MSHGFERGPSDTDAPGSAQEMALFRRVGRCGLTNLVIEISRRSFSAGLEFRSPIHPVFRRANQYKMQFTYLNRNDLRRYQDDLRHVSLREMLEAIDRSTPGLGQPLDVDFMSADVIYPDGDPDGEGYIYARPDPNQAMRLDDDRDSIRATVEEFISPETECTWDNRPIDLTLAYIPPGTPSQIVSNTLAVINKYLPEQAHLLPTFCPPLPDFEWR